MDYQINQNYKYYFCEKPQIMIDTHTHIYLPEFDDDRETMIMRAKDAGVTKLFLPNIDSSSIAPMMNICKKNPEFCYAMIGLHPSSVKENYLNEMDIIKTWLTKEKFCAIGEIGIDLYRDKTFFTQQKVAFVNQIELAIQYKLPIIIHARNAFDEIFKILDCFKELPNGIFHCFSGNTQQAKKAIDMGFLLGIGGVVTFTNSGLQQVLQDIGITHLVLETDAPFLAPVPFRGKRNEPAYLKNIVNKIAESLEIPTQEVIEKTTKNAEKIFILSAN